MNLIFKNLDELHLNGNDKNKLIQFKNDNYLKTIFIQFI